VAFLRPLPAQDIDMRIRFLLFFVSSTLFAPLLLSQAIRYAITDLEEGTKPFGVVYAMNAKGDVVGDANFQAFIWSHGSLSVPAPLANGFSTARSINDLGQVVGGFAPNGTSAAFLLDGGVVTKLDVPLGTTYSLAPAINNQGEILLNTRAGLGTTAFLLTHEARRQIPSFGGFIEAHALNQLGQVVGESSKAGTVPSHAFLWSGEQSIDLGVLPGGEAGGNCGFCAAPNFSNATAINDSGEIVGQSAAAGQVLHAFVWRGSGMEDLGTLPGDNRSYASSINNRGQIVGWSGHATGVIIDYTRAVLWSEGTIVKLDEFIPADSGWTLDIAVAINSSGQIAGTGHRNGLARPFLLTPIRPSRLTNCFSTMMRFGCDSCCDAYPPLLRR
jgi:probable HAF family extracellular repeat protein